MAVRVVLTALLAVVLSPGIADARRVTVAIHPLDGYATGPHSRSRSGSASRSRTTGA